MRGSRAVALAAAALIAPAVMIGISVPAASAASAPARSAHAAPGSRWAGHRDSGPLSTSMEKTLRGGCRADPAGPVNMSGIGKRLRSVISPRAFD